jgi:5-formaminoimidazole-4-carboxamide-1-beta-D-ribofuranosyl 5'-monophosphate synthetase
MDNTEIIRNCNKEELMEIINAARDNLNDYKQSTDSEILQALINGDITIIPDISNSYFQSIFYSQQHAGLAVAVFGKRDISFGIIQTNPPINPCRELIFD